MCTLMASYQSNVFVCVSAISTCVDNLASMEIQHPLCMFACDQWAFSQNSTQQAVDF